MIPGKGEFGKWHPGWGREIAKPLFTVWGPVVKTNQKRSFLKVRKRAFSSRFHQNPVYEFQHWTVDVNIVRALAGKVI